MMDIRAIVFRSLAFGLIIFITASVFSVISTLLAYLFTDLAGVKSSIISSIVIATLLTTFYQPLRRLIERTTNTFLYKKSYNPDVLLAQISEATSSILDLHNLLASISKTLVDALHCEKMGVVLLNKANKLEIYYQEGFVLAEAEKLANFPDVVSILQKQLQNLGGALVIDEMKTRYENGEFRPESPELLLALYQTDIALILPLHVKEQLIGIVVLGTKKSGDPYNSQDLSILK
ncbi:MAG: GAF domain-containing protein, partial [Patescibacteria group bacterium]